ncbi:hypothetical protein AAC387_Pa06g0309 [Persea americana]
MPPLLHLPSLVHAHVRQLPPPLEARSGPGPCIAPSPPPSLPSTPLPFSLPPASTLHPLLPPSLLLPLLPRYPIPWLSILLLLPVSLSLSMAMCCIFPSLHSPSLLSIPHSLLLPYEIPPNPLPFPTFPSSTLLPMLMPSSPSLNIHDQQDWILFPPPNLLSFVSIHMMTWIICGGPL